MSKVMVYGFNINNYWTCQLLLKLGYSIDFIANSNSNQQIKNCEFIDIVDFNKSKEYIKNKLLKCKFLLVEDGYDLRDPIIDLAQQLEIKVINELELCSIYCKDKIIAITGTNGKTSVVTMLSEIMKKSNINHIVCGHGWIPFAKVVFDMFESNIRYKYILLEVGVKQLELAVNFLPRISLVTTLSDNFSERYGSMANYYKIKMTVYRNASIKAFHVVNFDVDYLSFKYVGNSAELITYSIRKPADVFIKDGWIIMFNEKVLEYDKVKIKTDIGNIMAVTIIAKILSVSNEKIQDVLYNFNSLPNVLFLHSSNSYGMFIDDTKSNNMQSTKLAISTFPNSNIIFGGDDINIDLSMIASAIINKVDNLYVFGKATEVIFDYFNKISFKNVIKCYSLEKAFEEIRKNCNKNSITIISPGMKSNICYQDISKKFFQLIEELS